MIPVIINADDFGVSDGVCRAILELLEAKAISNTTIMVVTPNAIERSKHWGVANLKGVAGLHLQLTDGKPVSPAKDVPSLVDPISGNFLPRESVEKFNLNEVSLEWERQLEVVTELLGGLPTHLDSHKGIHRLPQLSDLYLSMAAKHKLPVRGGVTRDLAEKMKFMDISGSTIILREWTGHSLGLPALKESLTATANSIHKGDVIEVVTHPGYSDEYLESVSSLNKGRDNDRIDLMKLSQENWLTNAGFRLVKFPEL